MRIIENPQQFRERLRAKLKEQIAGPNANDAVAADTADDSESKIAINLERGIYNFILQKASRENIVKKWDNPYFVQA